ncbi:MAG: glycosyltransferase family 4 protein [Candidatus Rokubacteria bacterium]|nr:glycosyltransferase family 4 protein [Candidatus Rokubacteria bacterium]
MKAKILYVIDNLEFGGGERGFAQLAEALRDRYEIRFACAPGGLLGRRLQSMAVPIRPLDFRRQLSLMRILRLSAIMRHEQVDLVHSMGARADFAARIAARLAGRPLVVSTVAMFVDGYEVSALKRALYRRVIRLTERLTDGFIAVSDAVRKTLVEGHRIPEAKVRRIYSGVELEAFSPEGQNGFGLRRELALEPGAPVVGTIGRLVYQKAQHVFLQAASLAQRSIPNVQVLIVGDGPFRRSLEGLSRELGLHACRFAGFREDVPHLLSLMDVFALPSILEGLPRVLLEALAMARPVVATRIDGVAEVVQHGGAGLLVRPRDPVALADAIVSLVKDPELARRLGGAGRKLIEDRFTVERMVDEVEAFYTTLLEKEAR